MEAFFINVGHFERGFLNTFSNKWRLLFRNVRLLKNREVKAFLNEDFIKITRLFEGISREMEASV
jgi:hypothetical protein